MPCNLSTTNPQRQNVSKKLRPSDIDQDIEQAQTGSSNGGDSESDIIALYPNIKCSDPNMEFCAKISFEGEDEKDQIVPFTSETVTSTQKRESF